MISSRQPYFHYAVLEIPVTANETEIRQAYKKLAIKYHPDKNDGNKNAAEMFKRIHEASEVLLNPDERKTYDEISLAEIQNMTECRETKPMEWNCAPVKKRSASRPKSETCGEIEENLYIKIMAEMSKRPIGLVRKKKRDILGGIGRRLKGLFDHLRGIHYNSSIPYELWRDAVDGQTYRTVHIGNQVWFAENINRIENSNHEPVGRYHPCNENNRKRWGRLYTLKEAAQICPNGWRIPTLRDWVNLKVTIAKTCLSKNGAKWNNRIFLFVPSYWKAMRRASSVFDGGPFCVFGICDISFFLFPLALVLFPLVFVFWLLWILVKAFADSQREDRFGFSVLDARPLVFDDGDLGWIKDDDAEKFICFLVSEPGLETAVFALGEMPTLMQFESEFAASLRFVRDA